MIQAGGELPPAGTAWQAGYKKIKREADADYKK
jgi:hypothetical protein